MKRSTLVLLIAIAVKLSLQYLLVNPVYELQRDEYLHLDQGLHLAWGYISVPPVTSWLSCLIHIMGAGYFWVKLVPALFGCATMVLLWKIVKLFNGSLFAQVLTLTAFIVSPVLRINMLYQPNSLDIFSWTLVYYCLIQYFYTHRSKWLYYTAVAAAFGFLSKYNILFLFAGLLPALLLTPQRAVLANWHLYMALALGLLLVTPNLLWQYNNHFPTLQQLKELQQTQLVNVHRADFLKDQLLYFISSLFIIIAALAGFVIYKPFKPYRFILLQFIFLPPIVHAYKAKSYYAIALYPVLMAFGSVYIGALLAARRYRWLRSAAVSVVIALALPFIILSFPVKSPAALATDLGMHRKLGMLRWEDGKDHNLPQDFADMLGWKELAAKVDGTYAPIADKEHTLVLCDNYGQAGAINYYSRYRHINAVSYNADYINWIPLDKPILNVVRIYDAGEAEKDMPKLQAVFNTVTITGSILNDNARYGTSILLLQGARINVNAIIEADIREKGTVNYSYK